MGQLVHTFLDVSPRDCSNHCTERYPVDTVGSNGRHSERVVMDIDIEEHQPGEVYTAPADGNINATPVPIFSSPVPRGLNLLTNRTFWEQERAYLLARVDNIEKALGLEPRTAKLRSRYKTMMAKQKKG